MNVYFQLEFDRERLIDETDLDQLNEAQRASLGRQQALEGMLILADAGQPEVRIGDTLEAWVQNLCFDAVPQLLEGEECEISYFTHSGHVLLQPNGPVVAVSGDQIASAAFPIAELAPALYTCGVRLLARARNLKPDDVPYNENLDYIESFREPAFAALEAAGLIPGG